MRDHLSSPFSLDAFIHATEKIDVQKEMVPLIAKQIIEALQASGAHYYKNVDDLYRRQPGSLIVRREQPSRLLEALLEEKNLSFAFDPKISKAYSNCALWSPSEGSRGLENAFLEGFSQEGGIVAVVGIEQNSELTLQQLPDAQQTFLIRKDEKMTWLDRTKVYSVSGVAHPSDIRFVVLRFPASRFPRDLMDEKEEEQLDLYEHVLELHESSPKKNPRPNPPYIFRGFDYPKDVSADRREAA